jgi:hypothetical protein
MKFTYADKIVEINSKEALICTLKSGHKFWLSLSDAFDNKWRKYEKS